MLLSSPAPTSATLGRVQSFLLITALAACGTAPTAPSGSEPIEASYQATAFTITSPNDTFDLLKEGVQLTIVLHPDGVMTGTQVAPGLTLQLEGTWDTAATTLHLHLSLEKHLLNQVPFAIGAKELRGEYDGDIGFVFLTLAKRPDPPATGARPS